MTLQPRRCRITRERRDPLRMVERGLQRNDAANRGAGDMKRMTSEMVGELDHVLHEARK